MAQYVIAALFSLFIISSTALAGTPKILTLKDGSIIHGQVIGMEDGKYTIESPLTGTMHIAEDQIVSISALNQETPPTPVASNPPPSAPKDNVTAAQNKILANPDAMQDIQTLASDPEVMAIISDPAFMVAVQTRDPATIQANPRTKQLMENPKIKALIEKLQAQGQN